MLMVVDVGNTNTVIGVYDLDILLGHWRVTTGLDRTSDEYAILFRSLLQGNQIEKKTIKSAIISCVVPSVLPFLDEMFNNLFQIRPLIVSPGIKTGISILIENPKEAGADRIVNAVAAYEKTKRQCIIIDFGTATTFDVVSGAAEYLGGIICPGITISAEALFKHAAKLPQIEIKKPPTVIGRNTINGIQSGIYYGYCDMVDGLIRRIKEDLNEPNIKVFATGGYAKLISNEAKEIDEVYPLLTLEGLKLIFEKNL